MSDMLDYEKILKLKLAAKPRWHPDERPTSYELDVQAGNRDRAHGTEGHTGFRCGGCAKNSVAAHHIYEQHNDNLWQTKQIKWQEKCDVIFREFDDAVAAHFPSHQPFGPCDCPIAPTMPVKPVQPHERGRGRK